MDALKPSDPQRLGDIELRGRLGQGGMARVYFGVTASGDPVAVKMILPGHLENPAVRERFKREIGVMGTVQGSRIAMIVAASDPEADEPWLAVDYIRGMTLREYVRSHDPLNAELGAALGLLLAEAIGDIHRAGLLHRDLSPRNVLLGREGPKVIDFGLAALLDGESDLTRSTDILGNPSCLSPEQVSTPRDLTTAADVYGLGANLLYATTGHYPYDRPQLQALVFAIADAATQPDLSGAPGELAPLIADMLAKEPAARPDLEKVSARLEATLGTSPAEAAARLAAATYVERSEDPPLDGLRPPEPPRPRRSHREPRIPDPIVDRLSERLRRRYRRGESL